MTMRNLFLRSARSALAGAAFGLAAVSAIALAQNITAGFQLSQSAPGPLQVDQNLNVYLGANKHLNAFSAGGSAPTTASTNCTMAAGSTDFNGSMTGCTGASNVVTFGTAFATAPRCVASSSNATSAALAVSTSTTQLTIAATAATANFVWFCSSAS